MHLNEFDYLPRNDISFLKSLNIKYEINRGNDMMQN